METVTHEARAAFSADLIRTKGVNLTQQLEVLSPLAETFAEHVRTELYALAQVPIKVTLADLRSEKLTALSQTEAGNDIVTATEVVPCWSKSDGEFDKLIAEMCLGGTGEGQTSSDSERPATSFDKQVRVLINEKIAGAAAKALAELCERQDISVRPRARMAARKVEGSRVCYVIRLLLNVFDQACEYEFLVSFSECLKLIGGDALLSSAGPPSAASLVEKTPFCIDVFLKPDVLDIRQILNLVPGEVLKLNVSAATPVELRLNGTELSLGHLNYNSNGGCIRLIGGAEITNSADAESNAKSSSFHHAN
jgi:flagellar motor switch protein FliM